jgi:hypothetical protein
LKKHDRSFQSLLVVGKACHVYKTSHNTARDELSTLMKWNGNSSVLIDRFDVRAFLDMMPSGWGDEDINLNDVDHVETSTVVENHISSPGSSGDGLVAGGSGVEGNSNAHRQVEDVILYHHSSSSETASSPSKHIYEEENRTLENLLNFERYRNVIEGHRKFNELESSKVESKLIPKVAQTITKYLENDKTSSSRHAHYRDSTTTGTTANSYQKRTNAPLPEVLNESSASVEGHYGRVGYMYDPTKPTSHVRDEEEEQHEGEEAKHVKKTTKDSNGNEESNTPKDQSEEVDGEPIPENNQLSYLSDLDEFEKFDEQHQIPLDALEGLALTFGIVDSSSLKDSADVADSNKPKKKSKFRYATYEVSFLFLNRKFISVLFSM